MYNEEQKELMLREYQKKAVDEVMYCIDKKIHALLYKPTGGGKTECAVAITFGAIALKKRVLFVCNRKDLVRQTKERYAKYGINAGIIQHGEKHIEDADVYILSIDSLKTRKEIVEGLNFKVIIIDEAHNHFNRRAYELLLEIFHMRNLYIPIRCMSMAWQAVGLTKPSQYLLNIRLKEELSRTIIINLLDTFTTES